MQSTLEMTPAQIAARIDVKIAHCEREVELARQERKDARAIGNANAARTLSAEMQDLENEIARLEGLRS